MFMLNHYHTAIDVFTCSLCHEPRWNDLF